VESEGLVPDRVLLRSVGEEEARDDLLVEGFVEVEGDLVRSSVDTGNTSIMVSKDRGVHQSCQLCATNAAASRQQYMSFGPKDCPFGMHPRSEKPLRTVVMSSAGFKKWK
jgi:hypothetical protein